MLPALATVAALALGAPGVDLRVGAGALERTRVTTLGGETLRTDTLEATPAAAVELRGVDLDLGATYGPVLRVPEVTGDAELEVLHRADLRLVARLVPTWRAELSAEGEVGKTDLRTSLAEAGTGSPVPTLAVVRTARGGARGSLEGRLDPRTAVGLRVQATAGGGDDRVARALVPVQQTVEAEGRFAWNATRHDVLTTRLGAGAGRTPQLGSLYRYGLLMSGLAHRFSPTLEASAGAGAAVLRSVEYRGRHLSGFEPAAEAAVAHVLERPARIETRLDVRLAPYLDSLVGGANQRLHAALATRWRISQEWEVGARGTASRTLTGFALPVGATAEVRLDWAPTPAVRLGVGATGEWQRARRVSGIPTFDDYGMYVAAGFELGRPAPRDAARSGRAQASARDGAEQQGGAEDGRDGAAGRDPARSGGELPPAREEPLLP